MLFSPIIDTLKSILEAEDLNLSHNPRGTDKGDLKSYVDKFYERHFARFRERPIDLLEIGFRHGASLALWSRYFANGQVLGVDNLSDRAVHENAPVKEWIERPNVSVRIGDAYSTGFAESIVDRFDIIIDDGPHTLDSQQAALSLYLPKLKRDGIFVIEDIVSGGAAIVPLLRKVPSTFHATFYDFRWHKAISDNCLFVVRHGQRSRLPLLVLAGLYAVTEGPARQLKRRFR